MRTPLTTQLLLKTSEGDALVGKGDNVRKVGDEVGGEASPFDGCLHLASWLPLANNLLTQFLHINLRCRPMRYQERVKLNHAECLHVHSWDLLHNSLVYRVILDAAGSGEEIVEAVLDFTLPPGFLTEFNG